jgi:uncharacterized cupin superfamily protein
MKKIDVDQAPERRGSGYPEPFRAVSMNKTRRKLGDAAGLTQFGVNLLTLEPGCWSAQRHWHTAEDEFVYVLEGELVLVTDAGEETMRPGDCAGFPAGEPNGHHLINRSDRPARLLEIGSRIEADATHYPDIDLLAPPESGGYCHRDGRPY